MARVAPASGLLGSLARFGTAQDCEGWNAGKIFKTETVDDVWHCMTIGAARETCDEDLKTPPHPAASDLLTPAARAKHAHFLDPGNRKRPA